MNNTSIIALKHFDFNYYHTLSEEHQQRLVKIVRSAIDNPDSGMGCYAMNPDDYETFRPFFKKVLADYHKVPEDQKHVMNWSLDGADQSLHEYLGSNAKLVGGQSRVYG